MVKTQKADLLAQELAHTFSQFRRLGPRKVSLHGFKPVEFFLLATLIESTPPGAACLKTSDLSTRLQVTPAAVTHVINNLEKAGYVERVADPADRRDRHRRDPLRALHAAAGAVPQCRLADSERRRDAGHGRRRQSSVAARRRQVLFVDESRRDPAPSPTATTPYRRRAWAARRRAPCRGRPAAPFPNRWFPWEGILRHNSISAMDGPSLQERT